MVRILLRRRLLPHLVHLLGEQQEELPALHMAGEFVPKVCTSYCSWFGSPDYLCLIEGKLTFATF